MNEINIIAVVGARLNSNRLPGKHLKILAGKSLIRHVFDRLKYCSHIDRTILATTDDTFNQALIDWAKSNSEAYLAYRGDVNNLVGRIDEVFRQENPDYLVYICGDSPLIDPIFIDHALEQLTKHAEYETIQLHEGVQSLHEGISIYSKSGWTKLVGKSTDEMSKEHVGYANSRSPFLRTLRINDSDDFSKVDHRISVDTHADLRFMQEIYSRWYENNNDQTIVSLKWVQDTLLEDIRLASINQHVQQKKPEKAYGHIALFCHVSATIGLGHVSRCSKIAGHLQETQGLGTHIHIIGEEKELPWLAGKTSWYASEEQLFTAIKDCSSELIVLDFHPANIKIEPLKAAIKLYRKNRSDKGKVIALDKMETLLEVSDCVFKPSFYNKTLNPKISFGWDHYLIQAKRNSSRTKTITVLTGGSDALNFGTDLPTLVSEASPSDWNLVWIQGPYAKEPSISEPDRWDLRKNPSDLSQIIGDSEIVLSAYGLSLFESIALSGCVMALPPEKLCEQDELKELADSQACLIAESNAEISSLLTELVNNSDLRESLRERTDRLFGTKNGYTLFSEKVNELINA